MSELTCRQSFFDRQGRMALCDLPQGHLGHHVGTLRGGSAPVVQYQVPESQFTRCLRRITAAGLVPAVEDLQPPGVTDLLEVYGGEEGAIEEQGGQT